METQLEKDARRLASDSVEFAFRAARAVWNRVPVVRLARAVERLADEVEATRTPGKVRE